MDKRWITWVAMVGGVVGGAAGAVGGIALSLYLQPGAQPLTPEAGRTLAWGFGMGMTIFFGLMAALFGYLFAVRQARGSRERAFALRATVGAGLLAAALPWIIYGLGEADRTVQSLGWAIVVWYVVYQLARRWQESQLRIRNEESGGNLK
jgi:hypothetical protein